MAAAAKSSPRFGFKRLTDAETKNAMEKTLAAMKASREKQAKTPETAEEQPIESSVTISVGETIG